MIDNFDVIVDSTFGNIKITLRITVFRTILISKCLHDFLYVSTLLYALILGINLLQNNV